MLDEFGELRADEKGWWILKIHEKDRGEAEGTLLIEFLV